MKKYTLLLLMMFVIGCNQKTENHHVDMPLSDNNILYSLKDTVSLKNFGKISDLSLWNDSLILTDEIKGTVNIFDPNSKMFSEIDLESEQVIPTGLYINNDLLYILDSGNRQIISYDLVKQKINYIPINELDKANINSILGITVIDQKIYLSFSANDEQYNKLFRLEDDGKLTPILDDFIGYVTSYDKKILASNAYYYQKQDGAFSITTGSSSVSLIDPQTKEAETINLDSKLAPQKLHKLDNKFLAACFGNASIVSFDFIKKQAEVVFEMPHESVGDALIGPMTISEDGTIYLVNNSEGSILKLVKHD